jgi:DNA-binding LacI/PurR family transcriptional regulator
MLSAGHRRLVFIGDSARFEDSSDPLKRFEGGIDRENGFMEACRACHAPCDADSVVRVPASAITPDFMHNLIHKGITGALIEWDEQCYAALDALKSLGLSVPTDFSIVMLGELHRTWENPLDWTMFTMPREQMGVQAAKILIRRLAMAADEKPETMLLPATIVEGKTIAPPPTQPTGGAEHQR